MWQDEVDYLGAYVYILITIIDVVKSALGAPRRSGAARRGEAIAPRGGLGANLGFFL